MDTKKKVFETSSRLIKSKNEKHYTFDNFSNLFGFVSGCTGFTTNRNANDYTHIKPAAKADIHQHACTPYYQHGTTYAYQNATANSYTFLRTGN